MGTIHAVQLKRICSVRLDLDHVGILPTCTKRWYRLDGRLGWSYPSSPTAWSRKYLPDGSSKSSISAGLDKPDVERGTRTDGQPRRGPHPHSRVSGEAVGAKCGPARRFPRAEAGGHRGQRRWPRHRFAYVLRRSWPGWSFTAMSRGVRIASMCWSTGYWPGLSCTVCRLNGLGSRGLDPTLLQRCNTARLRSPQARQRPHRQSPRSPGPPARGQRALVMCGIPQNIPAIPTAGAARLAGFIPLIRM
jgi:hypothetical protein